MKHLWTILSLIATVACAKPAVPVANAAPAEAPPAAPEPAPAPEAPKDDAHKTVVDIAIGSPDHTTLVAAVKAADLVVSLSSPGGVYTVFAPTNAAFDKLPKATVADLLKPENKAQLKSVLQHHALVPVMQLKDFHDGQVLSMADGGKVTLHVQDGQVLVDGAKILASIPAANGIVHVIDAVLVPKTP